MSHDVFISYAWGHRKPLVHEVAKGLRAAGVSVWLDESNLSSADYVRDMMSAVRRTRFTVMFVSRAYCASKSCRVEAMCAYTHKDNAEVIVVNLEDGFDPAKDPAAEGEVAVFSQRNIWVDMRTADDDAALAAGLPKLLDQLRARGLSLGGKPAADTSAAPADTGVVSTAGRASLSTYSRCGISVLGLRALVDAAGGPGALSGRSVLDVRASILDAGARAGNAAYCDWPASAAYCGDATAYAMWVFDMPFLALVDSLDVFDQRVRAAGAKAASYFWIDFLSLPPSSQDFEAEWSVVALRELMRGIRCTLVHLEWTREPGPVALGSHWCAWEVLGAGGALGALHVVFAPAEERALKASLAANLHETTSRAARFRFGLAAPRSLEERLLASAISRAGGEAEATRLVQRALNAALGATAARVAQESHTAALKTIPFSAL